MIVVLQKLHETQESQSKVHELYIYIFTNLLSTSIHGYLKKKKKKKKKKEKNPPGTRDKNISNHRPGEKRKNIIGQKKKK